MSILDSIMSAGNGAPKCRKSATSGGEGSGGMPVIAYGQFLNANSDLRHSDVSASSRSPAARRRSHGLSGGSIENRVDPSRQGNHLVLGGDDPRSEPTGMLGSVST